MGMCKGRGACKSGSVRGMKTRERAKARGHKDAQGHGSVQGHEGMGGDGAHLGTAWGHRDVRWRLHPPVPTGAAWLLRTPIVSGCPRRAASRSPRIFRECPSHPRPPEALLRAGTHRGPRVMSPLCAPGAASSRTWRDPSGSAGAAKVKWGNMGDTGNVGIFGDFCRHEVTGGCRWYQGDTGVALAHVGDAGGWGGWGGDTGGSKGRGGAWPDPFCSHRGNGCRGWR